MWEMLWELLFTVVRCRFIMVPMQAMDFVQGVAVFGGIIVFLVLR